MTDGPISDDRTRQVPGAPPVTSHAAVDAALADAAAVTALSPAEQLDHLGTAQDLLASVLTSSRDGGQTPIPGVL